MRRFAIADIHGCSKTFRKLINENIKLRQEDTLFILGDFINKGPDSKGVLDMTMELEEKGFAVKCLRGNHDQMLIDPDAYRERWLHDDDLKATLLSFKVKRPEEIGPAYKYFLEELPYYIETEGYILVHAGINFEATNPWADYDAMLNTRFTKYNALLAQGKKILHGHTPIPVSDIQHIVEHNMQVLNIDGGCSKLEDGYRHLVALNLDTLQIHKERNVDQ
jgi:serine/threonine protein phosphatase 1